MKTRTLSPEISKLLSGGMESPLEWGKLTRLGREVYQDGKAGRPYVRAVAPELSAQAVEVVNRFLLNCWKQGAGRVLA